jgi:hypothetical protein
MATITLTNATIADSAASGSVIGTFNVSSLQLLVTDPSHPYFALSGTNLLTHWSSPPPDGTYQIWVYAVGAPPAMFVIKITAATVLPPTVQVNGTSNPVTVAGGAIITATAANGPGNPLDWLGVFAVGAPSGDATLASWKYLSNDANSAPVSGVKSGTVHLAVSTPPGKYEVRFFLNNGYAVIATSAAITATGVAPPPPPPPPPTATVQQVTLTPATVSLPDNSAMGTSLSAIAVAMSDGSAFAGSLSIAANNMVAISGNNAVLARAMSVSDDGAHSVVITATQGGSSKTASLAITVAAVSPPPPPPPAHTLVLSLTAPAQILDSSPKGTVISTATVKYSDGTLPAAVTLTSSDPTFLAVNGMQLVLARALTSADDGTHHVTITASDGLGLTATMRLFGSGSRDNG